MQFLENRSFHYQFHVERIPAFLMEEMAVSSSRIRNLVQAGKLREANHLLGYTYRIDGKIIKGDQIGRTINFPTANVEISFKNKLLPGDGVYAVRIKLENDQALLQGMMNIGIRPTVKGKQHRIEVNLFDFDRDIYGEKITIFIQDRIRNEQKFVNLQALQQQLYQDKSDAIDLLRKN